MNLDWQTLPSGVSWSSTPFVTFRKSRLELESVFGPPQAVGIDSNGFGSMDVWALRFGCGMELLLLAFYTRSGDGGEFRPDEAGFVEIQATTTDFGHIAAHLPFELGQVDAWLPDRRTYPEPCCAVMRQDDNGHVFEVRSHSSRCAAERDLAELEALTHKQSYWLVDLPPAGSTR
ncbi:MAG: hypothetical protein HOW73_22470 [Polyangiaceae bacterium]|nr:hypothetical protein [Polyangiaceae bacterium]